MSNFKGTQGKWEQIHVSNDRGDYHKVTSGSESICNITTRNEMVSQYNAKLIASAPEMLEMLQEIGDTISDNGIERIKELEEFYLLKIKRSIEKATRP